MGRLHSVRSGSELDCVGLSVRNRNEDSMPVRHLPTLSRLRSYSLRTRPKALLGYSAYLNSAEYETRAGAVY